MTYRAILFDLDGVLVDSLGVIKRILREWVAGMDCLGIGPAFDDRPEPSVPTAAGIRVAVSSGGCLIPIWDVLGGRIPEMRLGRHPSSGEGMS